MNNKLLAEIKLSGLTITQVIEKSGIPKSTFYRKVSGQTDFDTHDIIAICNAIGLTDSAKIQDIFLG